MWLRLSLLWQMRPKPRGRDSHIAEREHALTSARQSDRAELLGLCGRSGFALHCQRVFETYRACHARGTRITTEVIEAWRSCNFDTLHKALDLRPWERSPLPREVSSLGCSEGEESDSGPSHESWHQAIELQRELIKIAGWPDCRAAFEENLRDAQSRVAYAQELVDHPERGGLGADDEKGRRKEGLAQAKANLQWREDLLAGLDTGGSRRGGVSRHLQRLG